MADVTLRDGTPINIDLYQVKRNEWVKFCNGNLTEIQDNELIGRAIGMTGDQVGNLPMLDYKAIVAAMVKKAREPLADPNLPSESSSASS